MKCGRLILFLLFIYSASRAQQAPKWIADAALSAETKTTLYAICADGKPAIIALGNIHSQATELLLGTDCLQKLYREHAPDAGTGSLKDFHVAFINVEVFASDGVDAGNKGLPVYSLPESDDALNRSGWNDAYRIDRTGLFLVTPDHLLYSLESNDATALCAEVMSHRCRNHPQDAPDVRLLGVRRAGDGRYAVVTVQNFSKTPMDKITLIVSGGDGHALLPPENRPLHLATLDAAEVSIELPAGVRLNDVHVKAMLAGDIDPANDIWNGSLENTSDQTVVAGGREMH